MEKINKFKVNVVFELEKENAFRNVETMRKKFKDKYNLNYWESGEANKLITSYQVKKYGCNLAYCFIDNYKIPRTDEVFKRKCKRR